MPEAPQVPQSSSGPRPSSRVLRHAELDLSWLIKLRWIAVLGQALTILVVEAFLPAELPLSSLLLVLSLTWLSNFLLWLRRRRLAAWIGTEDGSLAPGAERSLGVGETGTNGKGLSALLFGVMLFDVALLTLLLAATGGLANPFALFYLVHVILAALILRGRLGILIGLSAAAGLFLLYFVHAPLEGLPKPGATTVKTPLGESDPWQLYFAGFSVALVAAAVTIFFFLTRMQKELGLLETRLDAAKRRAERGRHLEAMATLAAGAAHELSSPLSTIAVISGELERGLEKHGVEGHALEDVRLVRKELGRCRKILDQMSLDAGEVVGESWSRLTLQAFADALREQSPMPERIRIRVDPASAGEELFLPIGTLQQALRSLIKNGLDASEDEQEVEVAISRTDDLLLIEVVDHGSGMDSVTLEQARNPFFTTKDPGRGMGLGLFLASAVVERLGGEITIQSQLGKGSRVMVQVPVRRREKS